MVPFESSGTVSYSHSTELCPYLGFHCSRQLQTVEMRQEAVSHLLMGAAYEAMSRRIVVICIPIIIILPIISPRKLA